MLYLISATPGTGKTCWMVKKLVEEFIESDDYKNRPIYANIAGLKIDGIKYPPDDFRECPDGSLIIYDEAQDIEHYNSDSRANNPVAKELSKHRHRGFDIYFITQDPSMLHKYVLKNVFLHYYLWRPAQRQMIEIYTFARAIVSPTKEDFKNAYDKVWWRFEEYYLQFYKSTAINTSKKVGSSKKFGIIFTFLIFMAMIAFFMYPAIANSKKMKQAEAVKKDEQTAEQVEPLPSVSQDALPSASAVSPFAVASAPVIDVASFVPNQQHIQPYQNYHSQQTFDNHVYGVASFGDKCTAYGIDNVPLDISLSECLQYVKGEKSMAFKQTQSTPAMPSSNNYQPTNYDYSSSVFAQPVPNLFDVTPASTVSN